MIVDERMVTYINSLDEGHTPFLEALEREAKAAHVPIIRREMQSFLKFLMAAFAPPADSGGGIRGGIFRPADV